MKMANPGPLAMITCLLLLTALVTPSMAEVPYGVKPQEVEVTFTVTPEHGLQVGIGEDGFPGPDDNKPNKRWGIKIGEINYRLKFWNVGEEGGSSGYLFWKKNYADAVLEVSWEPETAGFANGPAEDIKSPFTGKIMRNTHHMEPATSKPEFGVKRYALHFSGGPNGTFTEVAPYKGEHAVTGRVINGNKVEIVPSGGRGEFGEAIVSQISSSVQPFFGWDTEFDESNSIYATLISGSARIQQSASSESSDDVYQSHPMDPGGGVAFVPNKKILVKVGNQIVTGPDTRVLLSFPDGSEFRVKSKTIIQIVDGGIILKVGNARFNLQKQGKEFNVTTPTSLIGVLGTIFVVSVADDGNSKSALIRGELLTKDSKGKKSVKTVAGESLAADRSGLGEKQKFDIDAVEKEWASGWEIVESGRTLPLTGLVAVCVTAVIVALIVSARSRKKRAKSEPTD